MWSPAEKCIEIRLFAIVLYYNYANYAQALARIHRIGQSSPVTYIHLLVEDSIDDKVLAALEKKEDIAKTIVDSWRTYF